MEGRAILEPHLTEVAEAVDALGLVISALVPADYIPGTYRTVHLFETLKRGSYEDFRLTADVLTMDPGVKAGEISVAHHELRLYVHGWSNMNRTASGTACGLIKQASQENAKIVQDALGILDRRTHLEGEGLRVKILPIESSDGLPPADGGTHEIIVAKPDGHGGCTPCTCYVKQEIETYQRKKFMAVSKGRGKLAITSNRDMIRLKGKEQKTARQTVGSLSQTGATVSSQSSVSSLVSDYSTQGDQLSRIAEHVKEMQFSLINVIEDVKTINKKMEKAKGEREEQIKIRCLWWRRRS